MNDMMETAARDLKGRRVGVIGFARSGIAAAKMAHGLGARVLISDARPREAFERSLTEGLPGGIETEFGGHSDRLLASDIVVKSPGVPHGVPVLEKLRAKGVPVTGEIGFALRFVRPGLLVAVTGTNGKTTTTALAGAVFEAAGRRTVVGGNIGAPLASLASAIDGDTTAVLELSSYQLEDSPGIRTDVAAVLNVTPDHIEHHGSMENYIDAKTGVFRAQGPEGVTVLNYDDPVCRRLAERVPGRTVFFSRRAELDRGVTYRNGEVRVRVEGAGYSFPCRPRIPGMHNIENILAATAMAAAAGIDGDVIRAVTETFPGVEHRIELVRELNGVRYYNDSKATNVDSTKVALESFDRPLWLIMGGTDKGAPYEPLRDLVAAGVRGVLLIGEGAGRIRDELAGAAGMHECGTLESAVAQAASLARSGEAVLLSPACASFDQFADYEDRGRRFKKLVADL